MLDETAGMEPDVRLKHREALDCELDAPLDPAEREQYDRERAVEQFEREAEQAARQEG